MVKGLTKKDLIDWGISVEKLEEGVYKIYRTHQASGLDKRIVTTECKQTMVKAKHKHGKDMEYPAVVFSVRGKPKAIGVHRLVYAWFIANIPDDYDVDHIDNDITNNKLNNLQLLTRAENIAKRGLGRNQYTAGKDESEILKRRVKKLELRIESRRFRDKMASLEEDINYYMGLWKKYLTKDVVEARKYKKLADQLKSDLNEERENWHKNAKELRALYE